MIENRTGLHARPASQFVQKVGKFSSEIKVIFKDKEVNAKSIMGLMSLGIGKGNEITVKAEGSDADEAVEELIDFIEVELLKEDK
ncbi:phosphocarrier protein [Halanaerobium saccharolyticum]|uniref:Phosphocarrier protein HPr n=1 Tax=Halanaerobium saccharolyticum TaxID=43595 RepID=A0A4R7Z7J6_9FIRM|nr:HPr family phosphocarrier protein [Halanaerobium saccharolyticum]RAK11723.1 phosphocarrier protein [Halanaerobium saccharolyticum]TDW07564.1 phosphocarrier protein [Halanaerobium saccharolyticum]TDX64485.1 phosphocarrier protein [Halanaerobium saccharolyticum]